MRPDLSKTPTFIEGDKRELDKYITQVKDSLYPVIWLLPSKEKHSADGRTCQKTCYFVIATRESNRDLYNVQRYAKAFAVILNPLLEYLVEGLDTASTSSIISDGWDVEKFPNYSDADDPDGNKGENKSPVIDLWDAIKLTCTIELNNECLKTISWQTMQ